GEPTPAKVIHRSAEREGGPVPESRAWPKLCCKSLTTRRLAFCYDRGLVLLSRGGSAVVYYVTSQETCTPPQKSRSAIGRTESAGNEHRLRCSHSAMVSPSRS